MADNNTANNTQPMDQSGEGNVQTPASDPTINNTTTANDLTATDAAGVGLINPAPAQLGSDNQQGDDHALPGASAQPGDGTGGTPGNQPVNPSVLTSSNNGGVGTAAAGGISTPAGNATTTNGNNTIPITTQVAQPGPTVPSSNTETPNAAAQAVAAQLWAAFANVAALTHPSDGTAATAQVSGVKRTGPEAFGSLLRDHQAKERKGITQELVTMYRNAKAAITRGSPTKEEQLVDFMGELTLLHGVTIYDLLEVYDRKKLDRADSLRVQFLPANQGMKTPKMTAKDTEGTLQERARLWHSQMGSTGAPYDVTVFCTEELLDKVANEYLLAMDKVFIKANKLEIEASFLDKAWGIPPAVKDIKFKEDARQLLGDILLYSSLDNSDVVNSTGSGTTIDWKVEGSVVQRVADAFRIYRYDHPQKGEFAVAAAEAAATIASKDVMSKALPSILITIFQLYDFMANMEKYTRKQKTPRHKNTITNVEIAEASVTLAQPGTLAKMAIDAAEDAGKPANAADFRASYSNLLQKLKSYDDTLATYRKDPGDKSAAKSAAPTTVVAGLAPYSASASGGHSSPYRSSSGGGGYQKVYKKGEGTPSRGNRPGSQPSTPARGAGGLKSGSNTPHKASSMSTTASAPAPAASSDEGRGVPSFLKIDPAHTPAVAKSIELFQSCGDGNKDKVGIFNVACAQRLLGKELMKKTPKEFHDIAGCLKLLTRGTPAYEATMFYLNSEKTQARIRKHQE